MNPNDNDELAQLLEIAEGANRARISFLANVGDVLETPMHAILGNLELIDASRLAPDDAVRLSTARHAADGLAAIIDGLMQLVASEGRPLDHVMIESTATEFIDTLETTWLRRLAVHGQLLVCDVDGDTQEVRADWNRLRRVAERLLDNVLRHAVPGRVSVRLSLSDSILTLVVADSGPGIPQEHWDDVLMPFVQVAQSAGSPTKGVGIGLAVARRLLESVGGSLKIGAEGAGTQVVARMPVDRRSRPRGDGGAPTSL